MRGRPIYYSDELKKNVIGYFLNNEVNHAVIIAKKYEISIHAVHKILNNYFKLKKNEKKFYSNFKTNTI